MRNLEMLLDRVRVNHMNARIKRDSGKMSLWSCLLGDWETLSKSKKGELTVDDFYGIVRGHLNGLDVMIRELTKTGADLSVYLSDKDDLTELLPTKLSDEELEYVLKECKKVGLNMGGAMKYLKEHYPSQYDGKVASGMAKVILG